MLPSSGSRLAALRRAARQLVFGLPDDARLGLIEFAGNNIEPDNDATLRVPLLPLTTSQRALLRTQVDALTSGANRFTSIGDAMRIAVQEFAGNAQARQRRHLVLLCDGSENEAARWRDVAQEVIGAGIAIHTIGEPDADIDVLVGQPVQVQIGLLVPAIQRVREAAARIEHPNGSSDLVALNDSGERGDANAGDGIWSGLYRRSTEGAPTGFPDAANQAGVRGSVRASLEASIVQGSATPGSPPVLTQVFASLHFPIRNASTDSDGDLMPNQFELWQSCLNPDQADGSFDADSDARVNLLEYQDGTDPCNPDTDGGGETDGSERARAARGLDPSDDGLPPMGFAQMETADSEHEGTSVVPPNSIPIRYATHPSYSAIRLERANSSTGPGIVIESLNPRVSRGVYVDTQLLPGQPYWYRMHPRTATGQQGTPSPIFSAIARADAYATMGTMSLHFGRPRTDDTMLNIRQSVYQKRWSSSNFQMQIGGLPASDWLSFVPSVNFSAPVVSAPTLLDVAVRFRDSEGQASIDYIDSIMQYPPGALASVRLRVLSGSNSSVALRGVLVRIVDAEVEPAALSDSQGNAVLEDLLPGSYRLEINVPGQPSQFFQVLLSAGQILNLGDISVGFSPELVFGNGFE